MNIIATYVAPNILSMIYEADLPCNQFVRLGQLYKVLNSRDQSLHHHHFDQDLLNRVNMDDHMDH